MNPKPGYLTTEFWVALIGQVVGIVNLFHQVAVSDQMVNTIASIAVMIATGVAYIIGRKTVKVASIQAAAPTK